MDIVKRIGRYELPILSIIVIKRRDLGGLRRFFLKPGYDVSLSNGQTIHFTEEEKAAYDEAMEIHKQTLYVYGMAKGLGLRG